MDSPIKFQAIDKRINLVSATIIFPCVFVMLLFIFGEEGWNYNSGKHLLAFFIAFFVAHFAAKLISKSDIELTRDNERLQFSYENYLLGICKRDELMPESIAGIELNSTKWFNSLVIYRKELPPYVITLTGTEGVVEAVEFLAKRVRVVSKHNRLSSRTFRQAFLTGIKLTTLIFLIQAALIYSFAVVADFELKPIFKFPNVLIAVAAGIAFVYLVDFIFGKANFRIQARNGTYFTGIYSFMLFCFIASKVPVFQSKLTLMKTASDIQSFKGDFFSTPTPLRCDTSVMGYTYTETSSRKGNSFRHFFTSPVITDSDTLYNTWVGMSFGGSVSRYDSHSYYWSKFNSLRKKGEKEFKNTDLSQAKFYEVVFRQKGNYYSSDGLYTSAIYSGKSRSPILIVQAHFRTFEDFRSGALQLTLLVFGGILVAVAGNSIHIAYYR